MIKPSPSAQQDDEWESPSMVEQYCGTRVFKWCKVKQTEVHEGPYPPRSQSDDLLIRLTVTVQDGGFHIDPNPPHSFVCRFAPNSILAAESKVWVNFSSVEKRRRSRGDLIYALYRMGLEEKDRYDISAEIFAKVEPAAILLPQLAIDVNVRLIGAFLYGSFERYDDKQLYPRLKEAWAMFRDATSTSDDNDMPPASCCVCLEDFGGGVDDELIARLPCSHYFHGHCVAGWVKICQKCPLCRSQVTPLLCEGTEPFNPNPAGWVIIP